MTAQRWILHADMDAFYASVEQRDRPELRGKPVIIGARSARGVVSAASYEARTYGVRSAMPGFRARELCPDGIFLAGDMQKYAAVSRQVHAIFVEFTDLIEPLALDEAFLDVSGSVGIFGPPETIARRLKDRVRRETDLVVSVGLASSKLVAKIATDLGKPDGLMLVEPGREAATLAPLPVRRLFGIGPKAEARLHELGISTMGELASSPREALERAFGRHGESMRQRALGIDDRPVEADRQPRSIGEEATFPDDVSDSQRIESALTVHSETVATRARRAGYTGRTVVLKVKLARRRRSGRQPLASHELFPTLSRQAALASPTCDGETIRRVALHLWKRLALNEPVRLLGVTLTDLQSVSAPRQLDLFDGSARAVVPVTNEVASISRGERLGRALDAIGEKFGSKAVRRAADAPEKVTASDRHKTGED